MSESSQMILYVLFLGYLYLPSVLLTALIDLTQEMGRLLI